jgi:hypothetical protein
MRLHYKTSHGNNNLFIVKTIHTACGKWDLLNVKTGCLYSNNCNIRVKLLSWDWNRQVNVKTRDPKCSSRCQKLQKKSQVTDTYYEFNWCSGGGVQLGPLGTAATNRPIVPAPGDYDDEEIGGMMIGKGNGSTPKKPAPVPLCPPQTPHALPGREPGPPRWESSD